ncbi:hypothetical protein HU200_030940 [Digitaria exilis]|uniref:KIB1-4 beta-propeller domain-containing protein n=1 Tax=Digitaria exilis TaxID=1010633 RepID=A0A835BQI3_9POAL|nr:hypothetical protein HU200_030940 [Digitaria exilis]
MVQLIGWQVLAGDLLDYVRLRAVCAHWHRSTVRPRGRGLVDPRFHPRRWMMLPEGHGLYPGHPHLGGYVRFFNLSTGVFVRVHLPLLHDHIVLDSTDGLLLLLHHDDDHGHGTGIRLLHPFTGDVAELPPLLTLLPQIEPEARYLNMTQDRKLRRIRFLFEDISAAVTVSGDRSTINVMLFLARQPCVAFATAGDERWTLAGWKHRHLLARAVFFRGTMYTVSRGFSGRKSCVCIYQIDPPQLNSEGSQTVCPQPPRMIAKCQPLAGTVGSLIHLVECGSELMLVGYVRNVSGAHLMVYRLADLVCGRIAPIKDIGDHALFLGKGGICVSTNKGWFPSVSSNSIICSHLSTIQDPPVGTWCLKRNEQYHLPTGTCSPAMDEDAPCGDSSPSPYSLVRHIYTCCYRIFW